MANQLQAIDLGLPSLAEHEHEHEHERVCREAGSQSERVKEKPAQLDRQRVSIRDTAVSDRDVLQRWVTSCAYVGVQAVHKSCGWMSSDTGAA